MKRGDIINTNELAAGDRFYFLSDKKKIKTTWQVKEQQKKMSGGYGSTFMWLYTIVWQPERSDTTKHIRIHKAVFLRSTIEVPA